MPKIENLKSMPCPEQGCPGSLVVKHTRDGKPFWACTEQDCNATHGAHADGTPLGVPGDEYTRFVRRVAHEAFDKLWIKAPKDDQQEARTQAYRWLAIRLGLKKDEAHIGMFDVETCDRVIEVVGNKDWYYLQRWVRRKQAKVQRKTRRMYGHIASKDKGFDRRN